MCWNQKVDDADSWLPYQQPVRRMSMSWSHTATPLSHPVFKNFSLKVFEQGEKTALRMGENNSKQNNWQSINLKTIQAIPSAQFQKNKQPNQKIGQRTKHISTKNTYIWLTNTWKDAQHHSLSDKGKSKPQWGTISCQSEWLLSKSLHTINAGKGVGTREPSYTVGGNAN